MYSFPESRHRLPRRAVALATGSLVMLAGATALHTTSAAAAPQPGSFSTSFESGDPLALNSTVETAKNGTERRSGIAGASAHIPGSVLTPDTTVTASAENPPGEVAQNLLDADPSTKWLAFTASATLTYHLAAAATVTTYALTSANDAAERDPAAWTLQGSTDGDSWTTVDTQDGQSWSARQKRTTYSVTTPGDYAYYRLQISAPQSGSLLQLADWDLAAAQGDAPAPPMVTATGNGPTGGLNIKQNAGFTGVRAYQYAGEQTADGRVYETNVIAKDLSVAVGPKTRLSYKILPSFTGSNVAYPSSYAAIDLHFTDGSYLSQLNPVDQHGISSTAEGQGTGKILYADQWNAESTDLGTIAAGKTIDRVLLAYADPKGVKGTDFGGWVDDVTVDPAPATVDASSLTNVVDTRRGTNASGSFSRGNNLPISAVPNGFTFLTPVTDATSNSWEYYYQQGNNAQNEPTLQGLAVSHEPSPWMGDRNQLSVMPETLATPTGSPTGRALAFTHDNEIARPDYYKVAFDNGQTAETTPTDHGAVLRFTFPVGSPASLVFDSVDKNASFSIDKDAGTVTGWVDNGSGLSAGRSRMFFTGTFSAKPTAVGSAPGGEAGSQYASFDGTSVELRLSTSFIGTEQAQHNAALELTGRTFDEVHASATAAWQKRLSVVEVSGETDTQRETLYSSLYRLNLYPNSQFENTGTDSAPVYEYASPTAAQTGAASDTHTNAAVKQGKVYVNNGFWDTYRTVWPAYSLLYPDVAADLVDGFVQQYRDGGWVARWSSPGYADLMTGTSSDVAFAGAYLRGVPLKDPLATYQAALKNATVMPTASGVGRKGLDTSIFTKYTDTSTAESVSWALEGDINDEGLAQMAAGLAKDSRVSAAERKELKDEATYLADRAGQYVNLFDPSVGFFQGRKADGSFNQTAADYDPESWGGVYTETDGWNFAFHAPQDGQGLADLYGGRAALATKLNEFFSTPELANKPGGYGGTIHEMVEARAVRMGQFGMSNQPSHHIPYMYDYVQQPYKTQALVRQVMQRLYVGDEIGQGYTGDEDNGEMSSWYILSSLGIYPLQSGSPNWVIGSPLFPKVVVHRSTGDLTITASNNSASNVYVQSLKVDGKATQSTSVSTKQLAGTASLAFTMGPKASTWGTGNADVPASPTTGSKAPTPMQDATSAGVGTLTAANGQDIAALTDNDSTTQASFADGVPTLTWTTDGASDKVSMYTLTSGSAAGDPGSWKLQASQNGRTWTTVDSRSGETFPWRDQTRPFSVAHPGSYRMYRLVFGAGAKQSLAEVELLVKPGSSGSNTLTVTPSKTPITARSGAATTVAPVTFVGAKKTTPADYSASIDWGDGSTGAGTITAGALSTYAVKGTHTYAQPGYYRVAVSVTDGSRTADGVSGITVSQAPTSPAVAGFDSTCISDDGTAADCDGGGYSYSRQAVEQAGLTQGVPSTVKGTSLQFTLPAVKAGTPDNAEGDGQTVPLTVPADAKNIAFVGVGTEGNQTSTATLQFSDGSTQDVPMNFPDWTLGGGGTPPAGWTVVAATPYRLAGGDTDGAKPYLFAGPAVALPAGKTLTGVVMAEQPGTRKDQGRVHLFAVASDGTGAAALALDAVSGLKATTGVAAPLTLGTAQGGSGEYAARVQWGDASVTADAAVSSSGAVTASHTWTAPGTYTVHVTVSDGQGSVTTAVPVTVTDPAQAKAEVAKPRPVAGPQSSEAPPQVRSTLVLSSSTATPGEYVTASGTGYRVNSTVSVTAVTADGSTVTLGTARTNGDGVFTTTFEMPTVAGGVRSVGADNAAAPSLGQARAELRTVTTPH